MTRAYFIGNTHFVCKLISVIIAKILGGFLHKALLKTEWTDREHPDRQGRHLLQDAIYSYNSDNDSNINIY